MSKPANSGKSKTCIRRWQEGFATEEFEARLRDDAAPRMQPQGDLPHGLLRITQYLKSKS